MHPSSSRVFTFRTLELSELATSSNCMFTLSIFTITNIHACPPPAPQHTMYILLNKMRQQRGPRPRRQRHGGARARKSCSATFGKRNI